MDFTLVFDNATGLMDLALTPAGDFAAEAGLRTAVLLSLCCDATARVDDAIPDATTDRRGWWADFTTQAGALRDETGSRLWLLNREVITPDVLDRAQHYAADALAWMVADGVAESVAVQATEVQRGVIGLGVLLNRGTARESRFDVLWQQEGLSA
jgi:phage gp46-like protein